MSARISHTPGQIVKILNLGEEKGLESDRTQVALSNGTYADFTEAIALGHPIDRNELRKALGLSSLDDKLSELIARGKYDWVNSDITPARFPVTEIPELKDEKLFNFGRNISTEDAKAEMDKQGYRPATMAELLVYGAKNPDVQRKNPIVALGSVAQIDSIDCVGVLYELGSRRRLSLDRVDGGWNGRYRFLAVRK